MDEIKIKQCPICGGRGTVRDEPKSSANNMSWSETKKICPTCRGKGRFIESSKNLFDYVVCRGTGKWNNQLCPVCAGKGKVNLESI